jgi:hypothetical protein
MPWGMFFTIMIQSVFGLGLFTFFVVVLGGLYKTLRRPTVSDQMEESMQRIEKILGVNGSKR